MNWRANGTAVTFLEELHYYPFGMLMEGIGTAAVTVNAYKYNSKELNTDLGLNWSDYGARWYDASVGRWWSVDPLAEKYVLLSTYNYGLNNPIRVIDPDGRGAIVTKRYDENNKVVGLDVTAKVYIYGEKATSEIAISLAQAVNDAWNSITYVDENGYPQFSNGSVKVGSTTYDVSFNITFEMKSQEEVERLSINGS